ncbi:hypothetical protein ABZ570_33815 [Micromonospora sp. NPDC007271]|uniref:hypothetical protein n=1 Tax=Micromonospora sp. NPDC007271 TaxID=3154587 RepID=UPI0033F2BF65
MPVLPDAWHDHVTKYREQVGEVTALDGQRLGEHLLQRGGGGSRGDGQVPDRVVVGGDPLDGTPTHVPDLFGRGVQGGADVAPIGRGGCHGPEDSVGRSPALPLPKRSAVWGDGTVECGWASNPVQVSVGSNLGDSLFGSPRAITG